MQRNEETPIGEALVQAAVETLENLAFTEVVLKPEARLALPGNGYRGARISLGPWGRLDLIIRREFLEELACTLYGLEPADLGGDVLEDAAREVLNIIGGRYVATMARGREDFDLGLPELHLDPAEWDGMPVKSLLENDQGGELALGLIPRSAG